MTDSHFVIGRTDNINLHYTLGQQLGQPGQFGVARLATHKRSGDQRAVKIISKARFVASKQKHIYFEGLRTEIEIMRRISEIAPANIIRFYEHFEDELNLYLVMELCTGGELFDRIQEKGTYSEKDAQEVLAQMVEAVRTLHSLDIAHCDIKPDNFLFGNRDPHAPLKMIDFGHSHKVGPREYLRTLCGTPYYVAPEVLRGRYNKACDMWSVGVVMFVMLFGYPPFYADPDVYGAMTDEKIFSLVKKGFTPETKPGYGPWFSSSLRISDSAKDLIAKLLKKDVAERLTADEALDHPWLKGETASNVPLDRSVLTSLKNFEASCKFKQAVLGYLARSVSEDVLHELRNTFARLDKNHDGSVTIEELKEALSTAAGQDLQALQDVEHIMRMVDVNGDGVISYNELLMASVQKRLDAKEERLWNAFRQFDLDGDGVISAEEIKRVLGSDDRTTLEMISEIDKNGDGSVDYEEFLQMWHSRSHDGPEVEEGKHDA
eukprot:TRINITY_DN1682_c0_g1_i1.p1 TRINITY_DN1682_c0_g1~~TRINITY_DN1682_c0_g1_i1.p1  ORF type:complete len:491 (-),score=204.28 TRINITY_DN1682_c0_g1_i1:224-1696(-)